MINEDEEEPLLNSSVSQQNNDNLEQHTLDHEENEDEKTEDTVLNVGNNGMIHEV